MYNKIINIFYKAPMKDLEPAPITSDMRCDSIEFHLAYAPDDIVKTLTQMGFDVEVVKQVCKLNYDPKAISKLIYENLDYLPFEVENYMYYYGINEGTAHEWLKNYIAPEKTLGEILENVELDWQLTEDQKKELAHL